MRLFLFVSMVSVLLGSGCVSLGPEHALVVSNSSDHSVSNVVVESAGTVLYQGATVAPDFASKAWKFKRDAADSATVRWLAKDGSKVEKVIKFDPLIPLESRGTLYIQIENDKEFKLFFMENTKQEKGSLPWAQRPSWEGTPSMPGMSQ